MIFNTLEKLKEIKFEVGGKKKPVVFAMEDGCGLVKNIIPSYNGKLDYLIGGSVYGAVRMMFDTYKIHSVYRMKDDGWTKMNIEKIKTLAKQPMRECV